MRRVRAVVLAILIAASSASIPGIALAACQDVTKEYEQWEGLPQLGADGARITIVNRTKTTAGGFVATPLWTSTNNYPAYEMFVEVGVIKNWAGNGVERFYTAHDDDPVDIEGGFEIYLWSPTPPLNATVTLTVVAQTGNFKASYSHSGGSGQKTWANHLPPIEEYSAGGEQEHQCSRQDRAYVSLNQFRRQATGVWTNINNGSIDVITFPGTTPNWGHIDWCLQPTRFKFYINSQIPTGSCN